MEELLLLSSMHGQVSSDYSPSHGMDMAGGTQIKFSTLDVSHPFPTCSRYLENALFDHNLVFSTSGEGCAHVAMVRLNKACTNCFTLCAIWYHRKHLEKISS